MPQKPVTQSFSFGGPFNYSRQVCNTKTLTISVFYHTQLWYKGRKGIISNFWSGRSHYRQQSGFAGIGETDESDIGKYFQFQYFPAFHPWFSRLCMLRSLVCWCGKTGISKSAATTL